MASFNRNLAKSIASLPSMKRLDFTIYDHPKSECVNYPDDIPITERCSALKRLCTASLYFDAMNSMEIKVEDDVKQTVWVEFNEEYYQNVVEDTVHLVTKHDNDIQQIQKEWTERYGLPKCTISECTKTARHYGRQQRERNREQNDGDLDPLYAFHQSLHDRVHYFLFHLFDIGMRVQTPSMVLGAERTEENEMNLEGMTVDKWFAAERDGIKMRRDDSNLDTDRMEVTNNKFTIQMVLEQKGGITLRDALFLKLSEKIKVQRDTIYRIESYFEDNSFDSECIEMDLEDVVDSNIAKFAQNQAAVQTMADFIRSINLHRGAFSTGFIFKYEDDEESPRLKNISGEMRVDPAFKTLKEEVVDSGYLTVEDWTYELGVKARRYMNVEKVKRMGVSLAHIYAIILYCDFTELCTAFSQTFRRLHVFESMESVKKRHSKFAIFSRLLVDLVLEFGTHGNGDDLYDEYEEGPFFCGLNCILNVGSFAITLRGPCSTSIRPEVALNFAKIDGIILKLDNDTFWGSRQTFFDCSWISCYAEESERLWIAAEYPLRIVSIVIVKTANNYEQLMRALFLFDAMISGVSLEDCRIKPKSTDYNLVRKLIDSELNGGVDADPEFDEYLKKEWDLFLQSKQEIVLKLGQIQMYFGILSKIVVYDLVKYGKFEEPDQEDIFSKFGLIDLVMSSDSEVGKGKTNIFKAEWISIFPMVHTLNIDSFGYQYKFRLEPLLDSMKALPRSVGTVIVTDGAQFGRYWAREALNEDIRMLFAENGWNAEYKERNLVFKHDTN